MKYHLIVGNGKWSKKIIRFLKTRKIFPKIYIKTKNSYFESGKSQDLNEKNFKNLIGKVGTLHICTPVDSHLFYIKKYNNIKKIIVEKPFLENTEQLKKVKNIFHKKNLIVNYTDLFNSDIYKIKKKINKKLITKVTLNYSKRGQLYKLKYGSLIDWLDHPLSLILYLFKKFNKFEIKTNEIINKNGYYEKILIRYFFKKLFVDIRINLSDKNQRNIILFNQNKKFIYNLKKQKNKKLKNSSFDNLYFALLKNKRHSFQKYDFHKKIIIEKKKILEKIIE